LPNWIAFAREEKLTRRQAVRRAFNQYLLSSEPSAGNSDAAGSPRTEGKIFDRT
jgi:hypothetical protein